MAKYIKKNSEVEAVLYDGDLEKIKNEDFIKKQLENGMLTIELDYLSKEEKNLLCIDDGLFRIIPPNSYIIYDQYRNLIYWLEKGMFENKYISTEKSKSEIKINVSLDSKEIVATLNTYINKELMKERVNTCF